jgi:cytochrome b561
MASLKDRYSGVAIALHWIIAALLISNIGIAWYFNTLKGGAQITPIQWHKFFGITILILSVARLTWRLAVPAPKLPDYVTGWEKWLAQAVHVLFYVVMLGMPLSGWAMVSASPLIKIFPIKFLPINSFHLFDWPALSFLTNLPPSQLKQAHDAFMLTHGLLAKLAYGLIVLHVAGALKHQFISQDDVVGRMIPFLRRRGATSMKAA